MKECEKTIRARLFAMGEREYGDFAAALMPAVPRKRVIGVRTPALRKYAAEIVGTPLASEFTAALPHEYYEENNLHAFLIEKERDFGAALRAVDAFLPYIDNWATCDGMSPRAFKKEPERLLPKITEWLKSGHVYTVRYGMLMLMKHFTGERFRTEYAAMVAGVRSEEYYVQMMESWYFATALATNYDAALPYLTEHRLPTWVHNKTIQKAIESYRISDVQKEFLRSLKIKNSLKS